MEDFIVSARKYRPMTFDSVVGQENITQTLTKAIQNNHLAQAFLFCGPRGVGKTTCARILAREVNHFHTENVEETQDFSFNIFELDAASNNGVEDIRSLIDQVRIPPQIGKYKVYIIDEVHMLSTQAFNAFLKTLEEPPPYAIFILATTEKHKVLPTIISRCQVFDFSRIQIQSMVNHLGNIAKKEGITIDSEALHVIAEKADGALRDALSIFDQMVSFSGNDIHYQDVINNLNILDHDHYFHIINKFLEADSQEALIAFNGILNQGFDGHNFINGLANHIRNLLMSTTPKTANILEVGENIRKQYFEQAQACQTAHLVQALELLGKADIEYKISRNPRLFVEVILLKLCGVFGTEAEKKNSTDQPELVKIPKPNPKTQTSLTESKPVDRKSELEEGQSNYSNSAPKPVEEEREVAPTVASPLSQPLADKTPPPPSDVSAKLETDSQELPKHRFSSSLNGIKTKGLPSLKAMKNGHTESDGRAKRENDNSSQEAVLNENKPAKPFNLAELWEAWDEYANEIRAQDKQSYFATLTKRKPVMRIENQIELVVDNHVQLTDLDNDKANLLAFIRDRLQNWKISLTGIIEESEDPNDGESLYDPQQKFAAMAERNPTLGKMRQLFDLEVDYDG